MNHEGSTVIAMRSTVGKPPARSSKRLTGKDRSLNAIVPCQPKCLVRRCGMRQGRRREQGWHLGLSWCQCSFRCSRLTYLVNTLSNVIPLGSSSQQLRGFAYLWVCQGIFCLLDCTHRPAEAEAKIVVVPSRSKHLAHTRGIYSQINRSDEPVELQRDPNGPFLQS